MDALTRCISSYFAGE